MIKRIITFVVVLGLMFWLLSLVFKPVKEVPVPKTKLADPHLEHKAAPTFYPGDKG